MLISIRCFVIVALLFGWTAASAVGANAFDYYLLNLSWEPEFCHARQHADSEECRTSHQGLVVHGLWPQYLNGYPEYCSSTPAPINFENMTDIMPTASLARHEWKAHGTCSGLSPANYFNAIRTAFHSITIPSLLQKTSREFSISPSRLKQEFVAANPDLHPDSIAISCGNNYLTAVEICLNKDSLKPQACGALRDCHANSIRVLPVQ